MQWTADVVVIQEVKMSNNFDSLKLWAKWEDAEIEEIVSDETIAILQKAVYLLADESVADSKVVTSDNFVSTVREMRALYRRGSRQLGEAINEASDFLDNQEAEKAKEVYEGALQGERGESERWRATPG